MNGIRPARGSGSGPQASLRLPGVPTLCTLTSALCLTFAGCGSDPAPTTPGPGGGEVSGQIIYSRDRNTLGQIAPMFQESGGGFDADEVDSPCVAVDAGRPGGDRFLLYYEADGTAGTVIGVVTSSEEDFQPLAIVRTLAVGAGPGGGPYAAGATDPTVLVDKRAGEETRRYKMWFEGRGGAGGQTSTIMYGTSADGITWSTFTACAGLAASFASVRVADPAVVLDGGTFRMWFEGIDASTADGDGPGVIGYAESVDGVAWVVRDAAGRTGAAAQPVFAPSANPFDAYSVNAPSVVHVPGAAAPFRLWYEAGDKAVDVQNTIGYATSPDGLTWARSTLPVLAPSSDLTLPLPFDSGDLEHPSAVIDTSLPEIMDGHFLLWYSGDPEGNVAPNRIGLATGLVP